MPEPATTEPATTDREDPRDLLGRSFAQSASLIAEVSPAQWEQPTPCTEFDVRALVSHMVFAAHRIGAAGRGERIPAGDEPFVTGLADDAWAPAFDRSAREAAAAWNAPGALEGEVALPFGTFPSAVVVSIYALEQVTHAWDLAVATGSAPALDPGLAEAVLPFAHQMLPAESRGVEGTPFGPVVDVPGGAPAYDRLAGFMGRRPAPRPPTGR